MKQLYKSDLKELEGQFFDTAEACEKAEAACTKAATEKQHAIDEKKASAKVVDDAIIARDEAIASNQAKKEQARKAYIEAVEKARKEYDAVCDEIDADNGGKEAAVTEAVQAFCKKYKQPYHSTITYKDGSTRTYKYSYNLDSGISTLPTLLDSMNKLFWL